MKRRLPPLTLKLLRDVWRMRGQALAIALVMAAGVGMVIMSFGMMRSLEATRDAYYERYALADIWAPLRRAPDSLEASSAATPGIALAESRLSAAATLDIPGIAEPVTARIHSLPVRLNRLVLRQGRMPDPGRANEVVASEAFAKAARLRPGDVLAALIHGKRTELRIAGVAISPEYVYSVAPGQIFPDNRRFGVLWMAREPLGAALDMRDGFNEFTATLAPGSRQDDVIAHLDAAMARYGALGAYGRDRQTSDRFVSNEIDQIRTMVDILPPIFLGVAAFLLNILLARLVDTERDVIGLLKAFGYRDRTVMLHYAQLALLLSTGGLVLGVVMGRWLGMAVARMYQEYFVFPFLDFVAGPDVYLIAAGAALLAALAGAATAVWRAQRLLPAEAMRPPAPANYAGDGLSARLIRLLPDEPSRMVLRGLVRRPLRTLATILGLAAALALYISSASSLDNIDRMIELAFERGQRADLTLAFAEPRDAHARRALETMPGMQRVEPFRAVPVDLAFGPRHSREAIMGMADNASSVRIVDIEGDAIVMPEKGAVISSQLARKLGIRAGDQLDVTVTEGRRQRFSLPVMRVIDVPLGGAVAMRKSELNRLLDEGDVASGAHADVDPARLDELYARFKETPMIAGVSVRSAAVQGIRDTVAESMGVVTLFNVGFSVLIVVGVIYTSARISLSERARDLASMRVLGFRKHEAGFVLLGEEAVLALVSVPLGLVLGIALTRYIAASFSSDLFLIPAATSTRTLAQGTLIFALAAMATAWLIRRSADRLDLVRALKTRE